MLGTAARAHMPDAAGVGAGGFGWNDDPWVLLLLVLGAFLYAVGASRIACRAGTRGRRRLGWRSAAFLGGLSMLVIALVGPLDALGSALFSAHMVQHELLMLVSAPLCVLGRPLAAWLWALPARWRSAIGRAVHAPGLNRAWAGLTAPLPAWALHAGVLWVWHAPVFFQAALVHPVLHAVQHASFLASALLFWWSVMGRRVGHGTGASLLSLFTTMVHTGALGALLTLSPALWYPAYIGPAAALGFDPLEDQQLGGLVMWVPGGAAYFAVALLLLAARLGPRAPEHRPCALAPRSGA